MLNHFARGSAYDPTYCRELKRKHVRFAGRCYTSGTTTSAHAKNKKGPKRGEHVEIFRIKPDHNKGFYSEKC